MTAPTPDNPTRVDYVPDVLTACRNALGTLVKDAGAQERPLLVVIGGLVPSLLLDARHIEPLLAHESHPGTNDVDLCVQIDVPPDDGELYRHLEAVLHAHGYARRPRKDAKGDSIWGWGREVGGKTVIVEFLAPADGVTTALGAPAPGRIARGAPSAEGDMIGALRLRGAGLALRDAVPRPIDVDLLARPGTAGGGRTTVTVRVTNLLPFVALKSFAVTHREKDKDCFDLVWVLLHWPGGPAAAGVAARRSPVAADPDVAEALRLLERAFVAAPEREGCWRYARFQLGADPAAEGTDAWYVEARTAQAAVTQFLQAWHDGPD